VGHVVTTTEALAARLAGSERFGVVWRRSPLSILAVAPGAEVPEPGSPVQAALPLDTQVRRAVPEHLDMEVHPPRPVTATVALAWSPKWHARLDGRRLPLGRTESGLVQVRLPAGGSRLVLDYRMDGWDRLGGLTSLFTLLLLAGGAAFSRLDGRRRRTGYSVRAGRPTMTGFSAKHLAVAATLALAAPAVTASAARAETVPVNVCSDQNSGEEETDSSSCQAGDSAIPDQEHQGNGNFSGDGNGNSSGQGNDQGNENFNDQLSEQPA
jgi:hypothetical protein